MNLETAVIITKGWCLMTGAMAAAMAGLTPEGTPITLLGFNIRSWFAAYAVGCNVLYGFLSQSFGDWKAQKMVDAGGTVPLLTPTPKTETKG